MSDLVTGPRTYHCFPNLKFRSILFLSIQSCLFSPFPLVLNHMLKNPILFMILNLDRETYYLFKCNLRLVKFFLFKLSLMMWTSLLSIPCWEETVCISLFAVRMHGFCYCTVSPHICAGNCTDFQENEPMGNTCPKTPFTVDKWISSFHCILQIFPLLFPAYLAIIVWKLIGKCLQNTPDIKLLDK